VLTVRQARALADLAEGLGDGSLHLTSRGNVQLRGLDGGCGAELADGLGAAGLLPSAAHERVRNVVASPLSGLDRTGRADVRPWLSGLDKALCSSRAATALSGRFLFALDDGRGDVAGLGADVTLRAAADGTAALALGAAAEELRLPAEHAARAALLAAKTFLDAVRESGTQVWRVTELSLPEGELTGRVRERLAADGVESVPRTREEAGSGGPPPGTVGEGAGLSAHVPLGRLPGSQWRELTRVAASFPAAELRLTPWRGVVVPTPGADPARAAELLARLSASGLVTDPASPWLRVGACVGRPGCARSHADVRADAAATLGAVAGPGLPLYWSGCGRRCGRPGGDRVDVVAAEDGGYLLSVTADGLPPRTVPLDDPSHLAAALAAITS
jgi:precorrin-3B synthase